MLLSQKITTGLVSLCVLLASGLLVAKDAPRVASVNLCTDQLVLLLADSDQILSLSNLSHDSSGSYLFEQARQYPANNGESEQILALKPDLVLAGEYTTRHTVKMLADLGFRVETVPIANTLDQLYNNITQVAGWLGREEKGVSLVAQLQQRVALQQQGLAAQSPVNPSAAYYDPNGYTVGQETLRGRALLLSGWRNVAAESGIEHYGSMPLESLIAAAPDALIDSPYSEGTYSRAQQVLNHPALHRDGLDPMVISVPGRQTICAGPWTVGLIEQLTMKRLEMTQNRPFE